MRSLGRFRQPSRVQSARHAVLLLALLAGLLVSAPRAQAATVIYVHAVATGANNGTSWANAFTSLQAAIGVAVAGDEIWVAAGRYTPSDGDRAASFVLKSGVKVYGGFAGAESELSARDSAVHTTILSGDLLGNDGPNFTNNSENSYHVVRSITNVSSTVLDGFTISGGNANGTGTEDRGAGMLNENSAVTVRHVTVTGNTATNAGGGVFNGGNTPALVDVTISNNFAPIGGGIYNQGGAATLTRVTVSGNRAGTGGGVINQAGNPVFSDVWVMNNESTGRAGGLYNGGNGRPQLTNLTISGNRAATAGGGMYNTNSSPVVVNAVLSGNRADRGAAIENNGASQPVLTNMTIAGNLADTAGGAIMSFGTSVVTVTNSIIWGNDAVSSPEIGNADSSTTSVTNSIVKGGFPGGTSIIDADPLFVEPLTTIPSSEGDLRLRIGSPAINVGNTSLLPPGVTADRLGMPRVIGAAVDLGAYEWASTVYLPLAES